MNFFTYQNILTEKNQRLFIVVSYRYVSLPKQVSISCHTLFSIFVHTPFCLKLFKATNFYSIFFVLQATLMLSKAWLEWDCCHLIKILPYTLRYIDRLISHSVYIKKVNSQRLLSALMNRFKLVYGSIKEKCPDQPGRNLIYQI